VDIPPDDRSPLARAMALSATVMTIALEMALPGIAGYWLDRQLRTLPLCLIVGVMLGLAAGIYQLVRLAAAFSSEGRGHHRNPKR